MVTHLSYLLAARGPGVLEKVVGGGRGGGGGCKKVEGGREGLWLGKTWGGGCI